MATLGRIRNRSEIEGEMGDSKMGLHARLMSQALRKLTRCIVLLYCFPNL